MSVTAILVSYNSARVLPIAIRSLLLQPEISHIMVVDNASSDNSVALVANEFPSVDILQNKENLGFGCANNIALAQVKTPFALLVNPDVTLMPNCLAILVKAMNHYPECAIVAPQLLDENETLHESFKRNVFAREATRDRFTPPEGDVCADYISGALWLMRISHFSECGFFDPDLFYYYEDDDLCMKARKAGHSLIVASHASATHTMGKSSENAGDLLAFKQHHLMLSRLIIEEKYHGITAAKKLAVRWKLRYRAQALGAFLTFQHRRLRIYISRLSGVIMYQSTAS